MHCDYSVRKFHTKSKGDYWLVHPQDTLLPGEWTKLRKYFERNGGSYARNKLSLLTDFDPRALMDNFIQMHCSPPLPVEVEHGFDLKYKSNERGSTCVQETIQGKIDAREKTSKKSRKPGRPKKELLQARDNHKQSKKLQMAARDTEIERLKAENAQLEEQALQRDKDSRDQKEKDGQARIREIMLKIFSAKKASDLNGIKDQCQDNEEILSSVNTRLVGLKEENKKQKIEKAKNELIHLLASNNGKAMGYELLRVHGIEPTGQDMVVHGIFLDRRYMFEAYQIRVPKDFHY